MKQFIKQKQHFTSVHKLYNFDVLECFVKTHEQCLHLKLPFSSKKVGAIKLIKDLNIRQNLGPIITMVEHDRYDVNILISTVEPDYH